MARLSLRVLIPRILYSTSYTILLFIVLLLLVVTPGDHVYQTLSDSKLGNIFVVGGTYFVTALVALFIYASRLYTNRTTLAAIPKPYLPIEPGEISASIRKMITRNFARSALIAWDSRPRVLSNELSQERADAGQNGQVSRHKTGDSWPLSRINSRLDRNRSNNPVGIPVDPDNPPWGQVEHPGWSAPSTSDLPNLQFATVIAELPNLIEARAVSLASPENISAGEDPTLLSLPQSSVIAILQRTPAMGARTYLDQLDTLQLVVVPEVRSRFIDLYEHARFSGNLLTEDEFRDLMGTFSQLLESMIPLDVRTVNAIVAEQDREGSHADSQRQGFTKASHVEWRNSSYPNAEGLGSTVAERSAGDKTYSAASSPRSSSTESVLVHRHDPFA